MDTWAPIFSTIVDSSVWTLPDAVCKVWVTMLAVKDADDVVRYNAFQLGSRAKKSEVEVLEALKVLSSPDTLRIEPQPFEGRRIQKVDDGWLILNGAKYRAKVQLIKRRIRQADWVREKRAKARDGKLFHGPTPAEAAFIRDEDRAAAVPVQSGAAVSGGNGEAQGGVSEQATQTKP